VKRRKFKFPPAKTGSVAELKEAAALEPPLSTVINVRAAKDQLSRLAGAGGRGDGGIHPQCRQAKAKLCSVPRPRQAFRVGLELVRSGRPKGGAKSAEEIVREERDGRP